LSNTNEIDTVSILQNILELNKALMALAKICCFIGVLVIAVQIVCDWSPAAEPYVFIKYKYYKMLLPLFLSSTIFKKNKIRK